MSFPPMAGPSTDTLMPKKSKGLERPLLGLRKEGCLYSDWEHVRSPGGGSGPPPSSQQTPITSLHLQVPWSNWEIYLNPP